MEVYTGDSIVNTIVWNEERSPASKTPCISFTTQIQGSDSRNVSLPFPTEWKSGSSLPETSPINNDSIWIVCNKNITLSPVAPLALPELFSSTYCFYTGAKIYRGSFGGTEATFVTLTTFDSAAFGFNAGLNGKLISGSLGNASFDTNTLVLLFSKATLKPKEKRSHSRDGLPRS